MLSGESADVKEEVVTDWTKRLPDICKGYKLEDIFNADMTGLFYRTLPNRSMVVKGVACKGGKKAKDRMTALVACRAMGEKLKLLVIGRSAKPRAFQGYKLSSLGVTYTSNKKAWMTSQIFSDWLTSIYNKMKIQGRNILMLIDNCSAHPELQMSNVKLVFLPPNTTSKLQPCDAGIIQNLKQLYRKRMMQSILMNMEDCKTATELAKKITVLDAILWLRYAWDMVSDTTIHKCFNKCGIDTPAVDEPGEKKQDNTEEETLLDGMTLAEFASMDDNLLTTETLEDDWEENLQAKARGEIPAEEDEEEPEPVKTIITKELSEQLLGMRDYAHRLDNAEMLDLLNKTQSIRPKKKYCLFPISDRPYQNKCDPNLFYGFPKIKY